MYILSAVERLRRPDADAISQGIVVGGGSRWLAQQLHHQAPTNLDSAPIRITRIATGVPAGSDIEYADEVTMARAMEGRRDL